MRFILSISLLFIGGISMAQDAAKTYTLKEIIGLAKAQSPFSLQAETRKENNYWQWRTFKSNYQPQLALSGSLLGFDRTVRPIRQPDGTYIFQPLFNNLSSLNLSLSQSIGATGGKVSVVSGLYRFDDFSANREFTQYSSIPALINLEQPLFKFNPLKWDKKIEPLKYEESIRAYASELEDIALDATGLYFDLLLAQISYQIAETNRINNDTIFTIAKARFELGQIPRNELLQLQLAVLNAKKDLSQANLDVETSLLNLRSYIGLKSEHKINLGLPDEIPNLAVTEDAAVEQAFLNRQETLAFKRRKLEAEQAVAEAKGANGFQADLSLTYGLVNESSTFDKVYNEPQDQQTASIGFSIPILDWGRSKSRMETALANQRLVSYSVEQDERNFEQSIRTQVKQFATLQQQLEITQLSDEMAQERYQIAKDRYLVGNLNITDLNIALAEKDIAKKAYIASLRAYWTAYYRLRLLTLYDFEQNIPLNNN